MKRIYLILLIALGVTISACTIQEIKLNPGGEGSKEVEISISTSGSQTRAPLDGEDTDAGDTNENTIGELDLLVFDQSGYLYRREAYKLNTGVNNYRATLKETDEELTLYLLANCRAILTDWEENGNKGTGDNWSDIHAELVDKNPARLVNSSDFQPLPMSSAVPATVTLSKTTAPTKIQGTISLLRSVSSFDVYVDADSEKTADFDFTDLFVYYAANQGHVGAIAKTPPTNPAQYLVPSAMTTSLHSVEATGVMRATSVKEYATPEGDFKGIAYQMYVYENDNIAITSATKRPTRVIIAGYYKQTGDPASWVKSYYPIDVTYDATGLYRPLIRNWKYEFKVTAVNGPGCGTLVEASTSQNADLNIDIIEWNKDDVEIGATGKYYVSMERKYVTLWRDALAHDELSLTYRYLDGLSNNDFAIDFKTDANGTQVKTGPTTDAGVITTTIENDQFRVIMKQTPGTAGGSVAFEVIALHAYDPAHCTETVVVTYRNLEFEIAISQMDSSEEDWKNGGTIPGDL